MMRGLTMMYGEHTPLVEEVIPEDNPYRGFADLLRCYSHSRARTDELAQCRVGDVLFRTWQIVLGKHNPSLALPARHEHSLRKMRGQEYPSSRLPPRRLNRIDQQARPASLKTYKNPENSKQSIAFLQARGSCHHDLILD